DAVKKLKADGVIKPDKRAAATPKRAEPTKEEEAFLSLLFGAIHAKAPKKLNRDVLERLVEHEMDMNCDLPQMVYSAWGWDADTYNVEKLTETELQQFLFEILLVDELSHDHKTQT